MHEFMTRGGAISVKHLNELHRAADDLTGERRDVPQMGLAGPAEPAGGDFGTGRSSVHAGSRSPSSGPSRIPCSAWELHHKEPPGGYGQPDPEDCWGDAMDALTSVYAAAEAVMADPGAGSLPLASPEPYREPDADYRARLSRHRPAPIETPDHLLDMAGEVLGLPRARLVPVEG